MQCGVEYVENAHIYVKQIVCNVKQKVCNVKQVVSFVAVCEMVEDITS